MQLSSMEINIVPSFFTPKNNNNNKGTLGSLYKISKTHSKTPGNINED